MDPASLTLDTTQSSDGGRVKKAKKRSRTGSCIPCSKRRQKCDRSEPCSSCVTRGTPQLCKWESIPHGPSFGRFGNNEVDLTIDEGEDDDMNEDGIPPALRTTKLDLNENREMLKVLSKRIQNLESRVVSKTGSGSAPPSMGPRQTSSMSLDALNGGLGYDSGAQVEEVYPAVPIANPSPGASTSSVLGMVGAYDYVPPTPGVPLYEVAPANTVVSPPSQSSHVHAPARPQVSRGQPGAGFRVPTAPGDELYSRCIPYFQLVQPGEFVGRGNTASTLHSICSSSPFQLPYAKLTAPTSISLQHATPFTQTLIPTPEVPHLIQYLPNIQYGNLMIDAFFKEVNWRYGIPEKWFSATSCQMWTGLQTPTPLSHQLNPYWLCLFFSVLACAPQPPESAAPSPRHPSTFDSDTYFTCASAARRIAEDNFFRSSITPSDVVAPHSSPADGCVIGCLAMPLLCDFLAERGRVSEAWKLVGNGIRVAQSIGLHRDPASPVWQEIPEEEQQLRRVAWWGLYIWDKLLSYILGRPHIVRVDSFDVAKPLIVDGTGQKNIFNLGRMVMIQLADMVGEISDRLINTEYPAWAILTEMEAKFENLESSIPSEFRPGTTPEQEIIFFAGHSQEETQIYTRHRYMITTWYRFTRLKLYTLALKRHLPLVPTAARIESPGPIRTCAEKGIRFALELIKYQCDTFDRMQRTKSGEGWLGGNWYFEGCLSLFEATVTLLLLLTEFPTTFFTLPGTKMAEDTRNGLKLEYEEMTRVISRVVDVFSEVVVTEKGLANTGEAKDGKRAEIASKALDALQVLLKEYWWQLDPRTDQAGSMQRVDSSGGLRTSTSSSHSSPVRAAPSPTTSIASFGSGLPYSPAEYDGKNMGSIYPLQQMGSTQSYSGLVIPVAEIKPSPLSTQQSYYRMQTSVYDSTVQYPMRTEIYSPPHVQSPFPNPPLPIARPTYLQNLQDSGFESAIAMTSTNPMPPLDSSPYSYQPEIYPLNNSLPGMTYTPPFSFTPISTPSQGQSQTSTIHRDRRHSQSREYRGAQRHDTSSSTSTEPIPLSPNPAASAYAYDPSSSSSAATRLVQASPGVPPPGQGMKMIHYVAPGSTASSTTTASGMGVIGSSVGTMSFTVSSQEPNRQQQSTIVLSDLMGSGTPVGTLEDRNRDGPDAGYYQ